MDRMTVDSGDLGSYHFDSVSTGSAKKRQSQVADYRVGSHAPCYPPDHSLSHGHSHSHGGNVHNHMNGLESGKVLKSTHLSWRMDPDESLSDWTLVVSTSTPTSTPSSDKSPELNLPRMHGQKSSSSISMASSLSSSDEKDEIEKTTKTMPKFTSTQPVQTVPTKRYPVHQAVLGVGPRRSEFFAKFFRNNRLGINNTPSQNSNNKDTNNNNSKIIEIEVKPSAAAAFPILLDFMYSTPGTPITTSSEAAVALRHLSLALGIRELFDSVTRFIQKDLDEKTCTLYIVEAEIYDNSKILSAAVKMCAVFFQRIKFSRLVIIPPHLFEQVLASPHFKCDSEILSSRVASYCRCRPDSIDQINLLSFTKFDIMPKIAPEEALFLLKLSVDFGLQNQRKDDQELDELLYERCRKAAVMVVTNTVVQKPKGWIQSKKINHFTDDKQQKIGHDYDSLSSEVKVDLLEECVRKFADSTTSTSFAKNQDKTVEYKERKERCQVKIHDSNKAAQNKNTDDHIRHLERAYNNDIHAFQMKLASKDEKLRRLKSEFSKFTRVPNDFRVPPVLSEYTYKIEPEYNDYGEIVYGDIPPTALPKGQREREGWIYREERWDGEKSEARHWPMFYYRDD